MDKKNLWWIIPVCLLLGWVLHELYIQYLINMDELSRFCKNIC